MNLKRIFFVLITTLIVILPFQLINNFVFNLHDLIGIPIGLFITYLCIRYDERNPGLISSLSYFEMPSHSIKAIFSTDTREKP